MKQTNFLPRKSTLFFGKQLRMKVTLLLFLVTLFKVQASDYSQNTKITLDLDNVSVEKVFFEIKKNTEFNVLYRNPDVDLERRVTVKVKNERVEKILDIVFDNTDVTYEIVQKQIVLTKKNKSAEKLALAPVAPVVQETVTITGTVYDDTNSPLPGAGVVAKGSNVGTETDFDGNFSLNVPAGTTSLMISYLGFKTQEVSIVNKSSVSVTLEADSAALDEVVVVGYGTTKRSDVTGALASVSAKDFEKQPITRVDQAIQGRAAGVQVTQSSGAPGSAYKIRIRGANSISGNNSPLYLVDGMAVNDINAINANDIKTMEVLKDASATAIYGSRGANGVVLITTKSGNKGKMNVSFESFYGSSEVTQKIGVMTASQFAEGVNFAEGTEIFTQSEIDELAANGGEDWQGRFFRQANFNNQQLSISGGNDKIDYYLSGNYFDQEGTIINQNYRRFGLRSNINAKITSKVKVGMNIYLNREEREGTRANLATGMTWDPTTPAYKEDGDYNYTPLKPGIGNGTPNPLIAPENNVRENFDNQAIVNGYMNYDITDNLVLNVSGGIDRTNRVENGYTSILVDNTGSARVYNREVINTQITSRLTYTYDKNPNHKLKADVVYEDLKSSTIWTEAESSGFFADRSYKFLSLGQLQQTSNDSFSKSLHSFLGRVNYSLFDKYLITASYRADGSSVFRDGNRWNYYPSGSFAWKISEEGFMENADVISNLKARISYGVTGSQAIAPRSSYPQAVVSPAVNYPFSGGAATIGIAPSNRAANPDLEWEKTTQTNFGIDLGLWNSKLRLSVDYYIKKTTDLLLEAPFPAFVGPEYIRVNAGDVENKGFDITLGWNVFDNDDWHIGSNLSLSSNKNEVISLVDGIEAIELGNAYYGNSFPVNPTRVEVGKSISTFRGYVFEGVYQLGEEAEAAVYGRVPGDAKYKDVNGDGVISTDDITTVGDGNPDMTWGWNWDLTYKNFDLNFLLLGSHGNDIYNFQRMRMMGLGSAQFHAVHEDYLNRWTSTNPSNIPSGRDGTEFLSSQFIEDGSYVTLKSVVLGYTIPSSIVEKLKLDTLRLYMNAENLFILTDYSGFDPESTASGSSDLDLGIDYNAYPINRSFSIGVNLKF